MLTDDISIERLAAIRYKEGREDGWEEGRAEGREEAQKERDKTIAVNLLAEGSTPVFIQKITGLDIETIQSLNT